MNAAASSTLASTSRRREQALATHLGGMGLPYAEVMEWCAGLVPLDADNGWYAELCGDPGEAPVPIFRFGELRNPSKTYLVTAAMHGDETKVVDSGRGIAVIGLHNAEELRRCGAQLVVMPLNAGIDYMFNEGVLHARRFVEYAPRHARFVDPNLEWCFGMEHPPVSIRKQKQIIAMENTVGHMTLHSSFVEDSYAVAVGDVDHVGNIHDDVARLHGVQLADDVSETHMYLRKVRRGLWEGPPQFARLGVHSSDYLRSTAVEAAHITSELQEFVIDAHHVPVDEIRRLFVAASATGDAAAERLQTYVSTGALAGLSGLERRFVASAQKRLNKRNDTNDFADMSNPATLTECSLYEIRTAGQAGRALAMFGDERTANEARAHAGVVDDWGAFKPADRMMQFGFQVAFTVATIERTLGTAIDWPRTRGAELARSVAP
jgi:hypothetical protein